MTFAAALLLLGCARPTLEVPVPADLDRLDPQVRDYVTEKLAWVRTEPRDASRQGTLGLVYAANGLWREARMAFENTARLNSRDPLPQLYVGVATQELGDLPGAIEQYRLVATRFPNFPQAQYRLGDALLRAGRSEEAEICFRRMIELAPQEWRGYAGLGEAALRRGAAAEAAPLLETAARLNPNARIAHHLLGTAYRSLGRTNEARLRLRLGVDAKHTPMPDAWTDAARAHIKSLPDQLHLANEYLLAGEAPKAVALLEQALRYHPADTSLLSTLAEACNQSGQPERARQLALRALQGDSRHLSAMLSLVAACLALGQTEEALGHAEQARARAPDSPAGHVAKANVLLALERDQEALAELEAAARLDPSNAQLRVEIGDVWLRNLDRPQEALQQYQQATQVDPTFAPAYPRLVELCLHLGRNLQARQALATWRKLVGDPPEVRALARRLEEAGAR